MRRILLVLATAIVGLLGIVLVERRAGLHSARLLECLILLAVLAVAAWATRGGLRNALVVACSLLFGLSVLEGWAVTTASPAHAPTAPVANDSGLGQYRPLLGWGAVKPGVYRSTKTAPGGNMIFDTHVTIDDRLNRRTEPSRGPHPIVFFGDSWVYGDGVDDGGTLPQAFADLNHGQIPVLNLAFGGWSPAVNLVALQHGLYKDLLTSPRHFVLFTATFQVERTACKNAYAISQAPRYVVEGDGVRFAGPCASGLNAVFAPLVRIARRFALYDRITPGLATPTRRDIETYVKIVETFVATAKRDYGVETTVLLAPFQEAYIAGSGFTEARIIDDLRKAGIDVLVDHLPPIEDESLYWIPGDGHPTALANRARAAEIEAHLREVDPKALEIGDQAAQ